MVRIHKSTYEQIYNHLKKCNESFKPKLSSYVNLKEYSEKIYKKAILLEYFENEKLVGLIAGYPLTESFYITNVSTDPDFSGRGIGKTLLEECEEFCEKSFINKIKLEVKPENKRAIEFYIKNGFEYRKEMIYEKRLW